LKVLVDTFVLLSATTGIRTYCIELCEGLIESDEKQHEYHFPGYQFFKKNTFFAHRSNLFSKGLYHISFLLWKQLILPFYLLVSSSKGIICTDYVLPLWPRSKGFVVFHDVFFWEHKTHYNPIWQKYFTALAIKGVKEDSVVIATSKYTRDKLRTILLPETPIEVIYQSPNKEHFLEENLEKRSHSKQRYFLHVGYYDKRKNIPLLVKAYAKYLEVESVKPKAQLLLAGGRASAKDMDDWDTVSRLITQLKLNDHIIQLGFVTPDELSELYREAFALVFPSYDEGFGIPIVEAMRNGIPVVVSDRGASKEVLGEHGLIFRFDDHLELSKLLISLQDPELYHRLVNQSLNRSKYFSREKFSSSIDQLISKYSE